MNTRYVMMVIGYMMMTISTVSAVPLMIVYQGYICSQTTPFSGMGMFRFALVDLTGTVYYWSNDDNIPPVSSPVTDLELQVLNGRFGIVLGDPAVMMPIPGDVFSHEMLFLRTWFNDGTHGLQQISPDTCITSVPFAIRAATADNAATMSGYTAEDLDESSEIDSGIAAHAAIPDAHHIKTTHFSELTGTAADDQVSDNISINNGTLYAPAGPGNCGIGTVNPAEAKLVVDAGSDVTALYIANPRDVGPDHGAVNIGDGLFMDNNEIQTTATLYINSDNANDVVLNLGGGNTGIGCINPQSKLSVNGEIEITGTRISVDRDGFVGIGQAGSRSRLTVFNDFEIVSGTTSRLAAMDDKRISINGGSSSSMVFIKDTTNINYGTNFQNRIAPLIIGDGDGTGSAIMFDGNQIEQANNSDGIYINSNSDKNVILAKGGGGVAVNTNIAVPAGSLFVEGDIEYTGNLYDISDLRRKKAIEPVIDVTGKLTAIHSIKYQSGNGSSEEYLGLDPDALSQYFPEVVRENPSGFRGIDYAKVNTILIQALKELIERNQSIRHEINHLKECMEIRSDMEGAIDETD